jgi:hypothetical protein
MRSCSIAMTETLDRQLRAHLVRRDGQEDLAFATWTPCTGQQRDIAILTTVMLPFKGDRNVHGNVSFEPKYLTRALAIAAQRGEGLAFLHSHPGSRGWQGMSHDDIVAEQRVAPAAMAATGVPLVGLTSAADGSWSSRRWLPQTGRIYQRQAAESVRVVGSHYTFSVPPRGLAPNPMLERTVSVWGLAGQERLARQRIGIVGLGSVGSVIAEVLARIGLESLVLVDYDSVEPRNLDRLITATQADIGAAKVDVAKRQILAAATAPHIDVVALKERCDEASALTALVDCDVIFSCVDRPWPRRVLNQLSMAALIPVVDGGILVSKRREQLVGADWHVHIIGPERRCLECWGAYDAVEAALDFAGKLDDPEYVKQLDPESRLRTRANVLPFALAAASLELLQFLALTNSVIPNHGDQNYHFVSGSFDREPDRGCKPTCLYPSYVARGDAGLPEPRTYPPTRPPVTIG